MKSESIGGSWSKSLVIRARLSFATFLRNSSCSESAKRHPLAIEAEGVVQFEIGLNEPRVSV